MLRIVASPFLYKKRTLWGSFFGAENRTRTGTDFTPRDFKSLVSAYSTTAACEIYYNTFFAKCQRFLQITSC